MKNLLEKLKEKKQKSNQKEIITFLLKLKKKMTKVYTIRKYF